ACAKLIFHSCVLELMIQVMLVTKFYLVMPVPQALLGRINARYQILFGNACPPSSAWTNKINTKHE
ncbi:MAG: hypothetical protein VSS52_011380, partial [Thiotrichaceae bacterium]|nr:hypothetical protein [Thiotrichaceae bacterium]